MLTEGNKMPIEDQKEDTRSNRVRIDDIEKAVLRVEKAVQGLEIDVEALRGSLEQGQSTIVEKLEAVPAGKLGWHITGKDPMREAVRLSHPPQRPWPDVALATHAFTTD